MLKQSDIDDIAAAIELYYEFALNRFSGLKIQKWTLPTLAFDLRGTTAGTATLQKNHIRINPELFIRNKKTMLEQTVPHTNRRGVTVHSGYIDKHGFNPHT